LRPTRQLLTGLCKDGAVSLRRDSSTHVVSAVELDETDGLRRHADACPKLTNAVFWVSFAEGDLHEQG